MRPVGLCPVFIGHYILIPLLLSRKEGRIGFLCRNQAGIYGSHTHEKLKDLARETMGENTPPPHKTLPEETP